MRVYCCSKMMKFKRYSLIKILPVDDIAACVFFRLRKDQRTQLFHKNESFLTEKQREFS